MENPPEDILLDGEDTLAAKEGPSRPVHTEVRNDPILGKIIDEKYLVEQHLGGGGMGAVYKGKHMLMDREVAIKVLHTHLVLGQDREEFLARFRREAKTASMLNHPGAVIIHDFGIAEDLPYLVMEYNPGITLGSLLSERGALKLSTILHIMKPICGALQAAHNLGIIHRDLKPDNVMVSKNSSGRRIVQVLDFGIAKISDQAGGDSMTITGTMIGTPYYMSPEQIRCEDLDSRSDIYSLGVLLYQMLTGSLPFQGRSGTEVLLMHLTEFPPAPVIEQSGACAVAISKVVLKALEKDPELRQQDVGQLYEELRLAIKDNIAPASPSQNHSIIAAAVSGLLKKKKSPSSVSAQIAKVAVPLVILMGLLVAGKKNPAPIVSMGIDVGVQTTPTPTAKPSPENIIPPTQSEQLKVEKNRLRILWHRLRTKREEVRLALTAKQSEVESLERRILNSSAGQPLEKIRADLEIARLELDAAKEHWRLHELNIFSEPTISKLEAQELEAEKAFTVNKPLQARQLFAAVENRMVELLSKQNALLALSSRMLSAERSKKRYEIVARQKKVSTKKTEEKAMQIIAQIKSDSHDGMFLEASERYVELEELYDSSRKTILNRKPVVRKVRKADDNQRKIRIAEAERKLREVERQETETQIKLDKYKKRNKKRTADAIDSGLKFLETIGSILD